VFETLGLLVSQNGRLLMAKNGHEIAGIQHRAKGRLEIF
jgi:hypothetical protein